MTLAIFTVLAAVAAAGITYLLTRSQAGRELAEARAAWATELAAARQDNKWMQQEIERERESVGTTRALLDTAERQLSDAFQSLAAEILEGQARVKVAVGTIDEALRLFGKAMAMREESGSEMPAAERSVSGEVGAVDHRPVAPVQAAIFHRDRAAG